ncbi:SCO family protein [Paenibacillus harenae]|uniref:Protein SCO1/2 n=1 Tax=Paenibacillus harenae TaxID=306543 RepID=A0ABT9U9D6_PAEHA|nr:SCO family protein [Paenibacillus harenae]MDQ0060697.1 protein SCO1/2 [Paenibacillus harenae]MDQ0115315.1 protein SCO1/2 [Paenibacillus harenae]
MVFLKKHSFKIAVLALCAAMGIYLLLTYVIKPEAPLPVEMAAPAFELTDVDNGDKVSLESTKGKARIVYFYFANCPDVCPPTTFMLSEVQEKLDKAGTLGTKAELISITFDPVRDTPEVIKAFAERNFVQPEGWKFLRGDDEEQTIKLARDFGVSVAKSPDGTFAHMNVITIVDQDGQIRKWINGSDEKVTSDTIVDDLNKLL